MRVFAFILTLVLSFSAWAENTVRVELATSEGPITLKLYPDKAPKTVENFLHYVDSRFYNETIFHRVIHGFMIQGGGFDEAGKRKATTKGAIINEADNGLSNKRGTIAMARTSDPHSATAQFFINHADNPFLDKNTSSYGYAVFGEVTRGMDTVDKIANIMTRTNGVMRDWPAEKVVIYKAFSVD